MKTTLSPKELGAAIGVSESSLKRWADTGRLHVARTAGGHRRIQLAEAVRFIRESGFAVERPDLLGLDDLAEIEPGGRTEDVAAQFHDALLEGQAERARGLVLSLYLDGTAVSQLADRVIAPAMGRIGARWQHGPEGIFFEHRASDICDQALNRLRGLLPAAEAAPVAVGAGPEDDPYVLPSLMAATVLATEGWSEVSLGAYTPVHVLARAAADCEARLVWLALSVERSPGGNAELVRALAAGLRAAGSDARVVVGGPGVSAERPPAVAGAYFAGSMSELAAFAQGLRTAATDATP